MSSRPRPKARLHVDVDNPYARLGVSPLAGIDEIKRKAGDRRAELVAARKATAVAARVAELEAQIIEIQDIEKLIGSPAARAAYDREHPQSALLTVQLARRDHAFGPVGASALVTPWLIEELGADAVLPHADAVWLWLPHDRAELAALLERLAVPRHDDETEQPWLNSTR